MLIFTPCSARSPTQAMQGARQLVSEKIDANPQMDVTGLAPIFQYGFFYNLFLPGQPGYLVFLMCRRISSLICVIRFLTLLGFLCLDILWDYLVEEYRLNQLSPGPPLRGGVAHYEISMLHQVHNHG